VPSREKPGQCPPSVLGRAFSPVHVVRAEIAKNGYILRIWRRTTGKFLWQLGLAGGESGILCCALSKGLAVVADLPPDNFSTILQIGIRLIVAETSSFSDQLVRSFVGENFPIANQGRTWIPSPGIVSSCCLREPFCGHSAARMGFGSAGTYQRCWEALWPNRNRIRGSMATGYCDPTPSPTDYK